MPLDRIVYTAMLSQRSGFESDLTIIRQAPERFMLVTGSAQATRDADWITRHVEPHEHAHLSDVSAMISVLSVMGPKAHELLARVSPDDLSPASLKFAHTRQIDVGFTRVRAARMSHVGGSGFELYVPIEMARHMYLALHEASHAGGDDLGLRDAGYYAFDALRIETGRPAWGAELGPDDTPFEAGLMHAVRLDKPADFIGKAALLAARGKPLRKKLVTVVLDSAQRWAWGGGALLIDGQAAGELSSVGWSPKAQACVGLGCLRGPSAQQVHRGTALQVDRWGEEVGATAWDAA